MSKEIRFVQGNEACVEAALYAGLDFFAGYPITPSSEILELLARNRGGLNIMEIATRALDAHGIPHRLARVTWCQD